MPVGLRITRAGWPTYATGEQNARYASGTTVRDMTYPNYDGPNQVSFNRK